MALGDFAPLGPAGGDYYTWIFVCSIFLSLFVAWGIGANDVANAFGSSVGAKALTMKQAIVVASICEFLGSVLMGAGVVETIKGGLTKVDAFTETPDLLMYGMMCALLAAGLWLLLATFWELPVSTTHSIVGAVVGMACVASPNGFASVVWYAEPFKKSLVLIVISWILSPVLSAAVAAVFFLITRTAVLRRKNSFQKSLYVLPILGFVTFYVLTLFICIKGLEGISRYSDVDEVTTAQGAWIAAIVAGVAFLIFATIGVRVVKSRATRDMQELEDARAAKALAAEERAAGKAEGGGADTDAPPAAAGAGGASGSAQQHTPAMLTDLRKSKVWTTLTHSANVDIHEVVESDAKIHDIHEHSEVFDEKTEFSFKYLQVFTACCNSFAHGSNDVANAMGPFAAIYALWSTCGGVGYLTCVGKSSDVPVWILVMGGLGIVLGLATYGYKIMRVLGVKMTRLTNSRGYCIELAAALVVILGSFGGLPLSSTQVLVGAVTGVGMLEGKRGFNWLLLVKFFAGWVATIVIAGLTSAAFTAQGVYAPNRGGSIMYGEVVFGVAEAAEAVAAAAAPALAPAPAP